eukprot:scaffold106129_cov17-Tisochrysis_lutea.AAC.1
MQDQQAPRFCCWQGYRAGEVDVFELAQSAVASKPSKLQGLFLQHSDQTQITQARHKKHEEAAGQQQQPTSGSQVAVRSRQPPNVLHHQQQQQQQQLEQAHRGMPAAVPALSAVAVPVIALPSILAHLLPSSQLQDAGITTQAAAIPGPAMPADTRAPMCALRASDMHLLLSVLLLDDAVDKGTNGTESFHASSEERTGRDAEIIAGQSICKSAFLSRLETTTWAARRAAALHRCGKVCISSACCAR